MTVNAEPGPAMAQFKYLQAAALVRDLIADGTLKPGSLAPSGAELARRTGYSVLTCRRALRVLAKTGELDPGLSPSSRPRVPDPDAPAAATARALSRALENAILSGEYPPGSRLPSQDRIAAEAGVSKHTVSAAIALLRDRGIVFTRPRLGTFISAHRAG